MATQNINGQIQFRRDTAHNWAVANPVLLPGELGLETDTLKGKFGDGETTWNSLPYAWSTTDTTYTAGTGIAISNAKAISNSGVRSIATGSVNGTISVNTNGTAANVAVKGLGSAAYTASSAYAAASHTHVLNQIQRGQSSSTYSLDAVSIPLLGSSASDKTYGLPAEAITVEYSQDGGTTWVDYGLTDDQKRALFSHTRQATVRCGKRGSNADATANDMLRITIIPTDRYVYLDGVYVYSYAPSGTGSCLFDIEKSTIGNKTTFTTVASDNPMNGNPGDNIRWFSGSTWGGSASQTNNGYAYRITFKMMGNYKVFATTDIRFFGNKVYSCTNNNVKSYLYDNLLYGIDLNQNATFPAKVTATGGFIGDLTGTASKATSVAIEAGTANADRYVWFSWSGTGNEGKACYDAAFKYNPYTDNLTVGKINGMAVNSFVQDTDLSAVATSGSYADLSNKPTIPTVPTNVSAFTNDAGYLTDVSWSQVTGKPGSFTPSAHNQASNTINAMTGYSKPSTTSAITASDSLNTAIGKLEKALEPDVSLSINDPGGSAVWIEVPVEHLIVGSTTPTDHNAIWIEIIA